MRGRKRGSGTGQWEANIVKFLRAGDKFGASWMVFILELWKMTVRVRYGILSRLRMTGIGSASTFL